ncbi:hypothetical protein ACWT_3106 [Actinoplanes sp. SE50]|uniref:trypco2 family protein n=1 Tax=unclassified Actinoplanes TaxID=2626549 RepID=UPI00023EC453|nr:MULTISPECIES: trypco2 family protein [unclassified Actinoplanes]AEV84129.1 hypothetical protein ACPL_3234 [Actinoplanes sp. SE50/110]ATO82521.1 hypothetical protein ACWT_3106 [Actinoplanes sp. SE50]SLL99928.1 uncharacterized protein ACSP50_3160 [Actinoplanes sp. SE50/110]
MKTTDDGVRVEDLIAAVKNAIDEANISTTDPSRDLRVSKVDLTLSVVASRHGGAGLELKVPVIGTKLGARYQHGTSGTQTVQVTLIPPPPSGFEVRGGDLEESLVEAITTIRAAIIAARTGDDPFVLESSVVTLVFAVTDTGSITLLGEGDLTDEQTSTLALTLVPADHP